MTTERMPRYTIDGVRDILTAMEKFGHISDHFVTEGRSIHTDRVVFIVTLEGTEYTFPLDWFRAELVKVDALNSPVHDERYVVLFESQRMSDLFALMNNEYERSVES